MRILLKICYALVFLLGVQHLNGQNIEFKMSYNRPLDQYEVYALPDANNTNFFVGGGSQLSIVLPASVGEAPIVITSINGGEWTDNSQIYAPATTPNVDYHSITSLGGRINLVNKQELLLFTFQLNPVECVEGIRLYENGTDPTSNQPGMNGGDFTNYFPNLLTLQDSYKRNYDNDGISCNTPPIAIIDRILANPDSPINIIDVQANDSDLENDVLTTTIIGTSTLGVTATVLNGDSIQYIAPADFSGNDTLTYQICDTGTPPLCDTTIVIISSFADNDNDGIPDITDLDDDNDGILDWDECTSFETTFTFNPSRSNDDSLIYEAIIEGNLETITLTASTNEQSLLNTDGIPEQNSTDFRINGNIGVIDLVDDSLREAALKFTTSIPIDQIKFLDLDDMDRQSTNAPTDALGFNTAGYWEVLAGDLAVYEPTNGSLVINNPAGNAEPDLISTNGSATEMLFKNTLSGVLLRGTEGETNNAQANFFSSAPFTSTDLLVEDLSVMGGREYIRSTFNLEFIIVGVPVCDPDGDGIPNYFDLDSDGDGCPDAMEAGHRIVIQADSTIAGPYGVNGVADTIETDDTQTAIANYALLAAENGIRDFLNPDYQAGCIDFDKDGIADIDDIDDDNDGILDVDEGNVDTDNDGRLNQFDLDSDGDGCPDATEAGHNQTVQADSTIAGPYGNNGLATSVENNDLNTAAITYTIAETSTGTPDYLNNQVENGCDQLITFLVKVMLQGPLMGTEDGLMRDDLRRNNFIPLAQPYGANLNNYQRFNHVGGGNETTTTAILNANAGTPDAIVDWVFIELRDPSNSANVLLTIAALVQRDGDVVDAATGNPLVLINPPSAFLTAIKHRNHLGAMKNVVLQAVNDTVTVDFTTTALNEFYANAGYQNLAVTTEQGKRALWAGNTNGDVKTKYDGALNDKIYMGNNILLFPQNTTEILNFANTSGYFQGDINMDGVVKYDGANNDRIILQYIALSYPLNFNDLVVNNFDNLLEQLP